jgi:hypothetical protein
LKPSWKEGDWIIWVGYPAYYQPNIEEQLPFKAVNNPEEKNGNWYYRDQLAWHYKKVDIGYCIGLLATLNDEMQSVTKCIDDLRRSGSPPHLPIKTALALKDRSS